ncbi:hypothetical protein NDU88_001057 [Pleurodeles waltl]|uniref:Uncharacterized protein n=1 Tax=Pleurodeles waltl TaxID=8319 RepID=A0AAV7UTP1_PLEWA|nr:hypothetical protein NDU88_001057 [Pleurodeles waltl]
MPKGSHLTPAPPLLAGDSREADLSLSNRLITSFYHNVGQKEDKTFSLQLTTEQNCEQTNKHIEPEFQFEKQDAALAQGPEQEPALIALRMEDVGGESYGRHSERGSDIRTAESAKTELAGSSMVVQADRQFHRQPCQMLKEQQSASESLRKESETREQQGRGGQESSYVMWGLE